MLYPSIDFARQNLHASKAVIKQEFGGKFKNLKDLKPKSDKETKESVAQSELASTAAGSVFSETTASTSHKGSRIAPLSTCSDLELDRMIRAQWRNNRHLFSENAISQISFSAVEKAVPGPKIVTKKTESKLKDRKDWEEAHKPSVGTYHIDDSITRAD